MKKIIVIISMFLILCGCGSKDNNIVNKFVKKIEKNDSYKLIGTMDIVSNEDTFSYKVEASKSKDGYYKVSLINKTNDHEQVILKNKDGVYVVTPDLNKSFRFQSDWPNNGSQSYLLDILVNDIKSDDNVHVGKDNNNFIQCRVNYPNNNTLYSEKIYLNKNNDVEKVEVLDQDGNVKITLKVSNIDYKAKFNDNYFSLDSLISDESNTEGEKETTTKKQEESNNNISADNNQSNNNQSENNKTEANTTENNKEELKEEQSDNTSKEDETNTGYILKDIIYPLYVPTNTHLNTEDTISTSDGNRAILTFSGDSPFVLIEEVSRRFDELEIIPVNGEPLIMGDTIGAISSNSLYWTSNGIDYYVSSNSLGSEELMTIAEGLTGTSIIVSSEK